MKLSKFILTAEHNGEILVKQLVTGSVIEISQNDFLLLKNGDFKTIDDETMQDLIECGFLVEGDENQLFRKTFKDWWLDSDFLALFIVPTNGCNCDCPYCYEEGIDRSLKMESEVKQESLAWVKKYFTDNPKIKELNLVFHGGEPLLCKNTIYFMLPNLSKLCNDMNVKMTVSIVSNGTLLDRNILAELSKYDLQRLQLTLDGPKDIHDQRRKLLNGGGTFDTIWSNMKVAIGEGFVDKIHLRINIDVQNIHRVEQLLIDLNNDEVLSQHIKISLGIVSPTSGVDGQVSNAEDYISENELVGTDLANKYLELIKIANQLGYETYDEMMIGPWCAARHPHAWMIGPKGDVYKCACDLGRPDRCVGSIFNKVDASKISNLTEERMTKCLESGCELVPICGGGCLFDYRTNSGSYCRKDFLEIVNRGLMILQAETE